MKEFQEKDFQEEQVHNDKDQEEEQVHDGVHDDQNQLDRVCEVCGKRVQGGKALGSHKRIHNQQITHLAPNKIIDKCNAKHNKIYPSKLLNFGGGGSSKTNEFSCHVCHNSHTSIKSLSGHMKSHPHRGLKGVTPPQDQESVPPQSCSSSLSESSPDLTETDYDLAKFLTSWANNEIVQSTSTSTSTQIVKETMEVTKSHNESNWIDNMKPKKTRTIRSIMETSGKKHVCSVCYKEFPTGRSLGGHKRAHNYETVGPVLLMEAQAADQLESDEDSKNTESEESEEFTQTINTRKLKDFYPNEPNPSGE